MPARRPCPPRPTLAPCVGPICPESSTAASAPQEYPHIDTRGYVHYGKTTGFRDLGDLDVAALQQRVAGLDEDCWRRHDEAKPNRFDSLGGTQHIVMKFVHKVAVPTEYYALPAWSEWEPLVQPVLDAVAARLELVAAEVPRVMLARLPAGGEITAHRDGGRFPAFCRKVHVVLATNPAVEFYVDPEWRHVPPGRGFEVNNNLMHAVRNDGATARTHLIFEIFETPLDLRRHDYVGARVV